MTPQQNYFGIISCLICFFFFPFGLITLCVPLDSHPAATVVIQR